MTDLEKKKKELELKRVKLAAEELKFKIEERLDDIRRLEEHIKIQDARIADLEKELGR